MRAREGVGGIVEELSQVLMVVQWWGILRAVSSQEFFRARDI
jgi:hypothetical protein